MKIGLNYPRLNSKRVLIRKIHIFEINNKNDGTKKTATVLGNALLRIQSAFPRYDTVIKVRFSK